MSWFLFGRKAGRHAARSRWSIAGIGSSRLGQALEQLEERAVPAAGLDLSNLTVDPAKFATDSIIVRFRDDVQPGAMSAIGSIGTELIPGIGLHKVKLATGVSVTSALATYAADPNVLYAEPNYRLSINVVPNDPSFNKLYGLHNTGQTGGTADADIDAPEAWDNYTGSGKVVVAVIDTGVDYNHPDLNDNIWTNAAEANGSAGVDDDGNGYIDDIHGYDFVNNDGDPMDDNGHGTHVSGTIAGEGNNGVGVAGVMWDAQIMGLKFLDSGGSGSLSDAVLAINYAAKMGVRISNNSWGGGGYSQSMYDAINNAGKMGHLFIAAAGNAGSNNDAVPAYPASYNLANIISVAATDDRDVLADFSNYGATSVDVAAPGVNIYSTVPGNSYEWLSGTSMATPHVSGVAAMVLDLHSDWTFQQIKDQILSTVDVKAGLQGKMVTGGRVNLASAATGEPPPDTAGPRVTSHSPTSTNQSVSTVRVTFDETVVPSTFTVDDIVTFNGPNGSITVTTIDVVSGSNNRTYDIGFDAQSDLGTYSLTFGPDLTDVAGNLMNQDNDSTNGEVPADRYTATFQITQEMTYDSTDVPKDINDFVETVSVINVPDSLTIADLNVQLSITHTWDGDMDIWLVSPTGTRVDLALNNGGSGQNFAGTIFDDEASQSITEGSAPFAGSFRPRSPLSAMDDENAQGTWELHIYDEGFADVGSLTAWSITVTPGSGGGGGGNKAPVAVDDAATTLMNTPVTFDGLGNNPPILEDNDSDPDGDAIVVESVGNATNGVATLNDDGTVTFTPNTGFTGTATFEYVLTDGELTDTGLVSIAVTGDFLVSFNANGTISGFAFTDADIAHLSVTGSKYAYSMYFDGSDVGLTTSNEDIDAFAILDDGSIIVSTVGSFSVPGPSGTTITGGGEDLLRFVPTSLGDTTAGAWSFYFDGSDVGLTTNSEKIDAIQVLGDGRLVMSFLGNTSAGGISFVDEDLAVFTPTSLGTTTAGSWAMYFDGSDVELSNSSENVDALFLVESGSGQPTLYFSTTGNFSVTGLSGADEDGFGFTPTSLGANTAGSYVSPLTLDGSKYGMSSFDIDGLYIGLPGGSGSSSAASVTGPAAAPLIGPSTGREALGDLLPPHGVDVRSSAPAVATPVPIWLGGVPSTGSQTPIFIDPTSPASTNSGANQADEPFGSLPRSWRTRSSRA